MVNRVWTAGSGEWGTSADWNPSGTPTNTDAASLANGGTINVASNDFSANAETLSVTNGIVNVQGQLSVDGLAVGSGASVNVVGGSLQTGYQRQGGTVYNQTGNINIYDYGNLTVGNYIAGTVSGTETLQSGGSYYYQDTIASSSANNIVQFAGGGGGLFSDTAAWAGTIEGFNTSNQNSLSFNGQITSFSYSETSKILTVSTTSGTYTERFADSGLTQANFSDAGNPYAINFAGSTVCFREGTAIATSGGDRLIQSLKVGDIAISCDGRPLPIKWLGHRTFALRHHPRKCEVLPIRISAHAFDKNRPADDLFVSPGHAICFDVDGGVLIPAGALVNGSTIQQVEMDEVTYWHVELHSHDVILAENLPCESYLDMGNRSFFAEAGVVDFATNPDAAPAQRTHADFCRPFHAEGEIVEMARAHLRDRAEALGWKQAQDDHAGMHLVVDGKRVDGAWRGLSSCFLVPAGAVDVWLMSSTVRPCDIYPSGDARALGVCLQAISIIDGFGSAGVALTDESFDTGFWQVESAGDTLWRWTNGRARLPAELLGAGEGARLLRIDLAQAALPRWALSHDGAGCEVISRQLASSAA